MTRYAVGLGSNLGNRLANLRGGASGLARLGRVIDRSSLYETEPIGGPDQDPYLNAVVLIDADLDPTGLLAECLRIEDDHGRERTERWAARTLDLDIVAMDLPPTVTDDLVVPHPRASEREFVLRPLAEVWPDAPVAPDLTAAQALTRVPPQGVDLLARSWATDRPIGTWLVIAQMLLVLLVGAGILFDGTADFDEEPLIRGLGLILVVLGAVLGGSASFAAGPDTTVSPEPRHGVELRQAGVYGVVRHPMYGGLILLTLGASLVAVSMYGVVASIGLAVLVLFKADYEERRLRIHYPAYASYRRRVPRRMIPGIF
jgi:2-amino-4-hydroxy-6-hydroxymethyldihydropteridine diphosphokinase